jgi:hypothetical protein
MRKKDEDKVNVLVPVLTAAEQKLLVMGAAQRLEKRLLCVSEFHLDAPWLTEYQTDRKGGREKERGR